jgi:hypothetical protein
MREGLGEGVGQQFTTHSNFRSTPSKVVTAHIGYPTPLVRLGWMAPPGGFALTELDRTLASADFTGSGNDRQSLNVRGRRIGRLGANGMLSVFHDGTDWRLLSEDGQGPRFPSAEAAERRGRWLTTRANVRGLDAVLDVYSADGVLLGTWRAECFEPVVGIQSLALQAA